MNNMRGLVDFHCHLDLYPNHQEMIRECESLGIKTLTVTNAPSVWSKNKALVAHCKHVRPALGFHPQLVGERQSEMVLFERYLDETRYVGEVGLDGAPEFRETLTIQKSVFERILQLCARKGDKILSVHSRRATNEVIDMLTNLLPGHRGKVVLHWFSGTKKEALVAAEIGCYFSLNTRMLESQRARELVTSLPPESVLTETDGPFVQVDGRPARPSDVSIIEHALVQLWGMTPTNVSKQLLSNLKELLSGDL